MNNMVKNLRKNKGFSDRINCLWCGKELYKYKVYYDKNGRVKDTRKRKYCNKRCYWFHLRELRLGRGNPMNGRKKTFEQVEKTASKIRGVKRPYDVVERIKKKIPRGSYHSNWKGGVSKLSERIKKSYKYKEWRRCVFERDNYTCIECGVVGGILHPHHKKAFSLILNENKIRTIVDANECKELWEVDNGETLCRECHKKTYNYGINK
jgi:5-methylcytosine-specific restriction endonuclease McrA